MPKLKALNRREAAIFASLTEAYCAAGPDMPRGAFPLVEETDAVAFIDDLASRSRRVNRIGFRFLLVFADLAPVVRGYRRRFRRLDPDARVSFLHGLDKSRWQLLGACAKLLKTLTMMSYYGDERALRAAGYDFETKLARGREVRTRDARP
jgi:hypothetical protein